MSSSPPEPEADAALAALGELVVAMRRTQVLLDDAVARAETLRTRRLAGHAYREIIPGEQPPAVVEIVSESITGLVEAGSRFRRAQARALRDEGLTMEAIAGLFGVTRQRVSHLLNGASPRERPVPVPQMDA